MSMKIRFIYNVPSFQLAWMTWRNAEYIMVTSQCYYSLHGSRRNSFRTPGVYLGAIYESWMFLHSCKNWSSYIFHKATGHILA